MSKKFEISYNHFMKPTRFSHLLCFLIFFSLTACTASGGTQSGQAAFTALNRDTLESYTGTFAIMFEGQQTWLYRLETRKAKSLREENLHIEGVAQASNPGDVRVVTDGSTTWMVGPGTDNECVQFPNGQGMDPTYILPETLASGAQLAGKLTYAGEESIDGIDSVHFKGSGLALGDWQKASVEVWQAKDTRALVRFRMQATGADPFFGVGQGTITARYDFGGTDSGEIAPVVGCEPPVPLPDSAKNIVRLPGLASFDAAVAGTEMLAFYQQILGQEGWTEKSPPAEADGATVLNYARGADEVQVVIEPADGGGSQVKLILVTTE